MIPLQTPPPCPSEVLCSPDHNRALGLGERPVIPNHVPHLSAKLRDLPPQDFNLRGLGDAPICTTRAQPIRDHGAQPARPSTDVCSRTGSRRLAHHAVPSGTGPVARATSPGRLTRNIQPVLLSMTIEAGLIPASRIGRNAVWNGVNSGGSDGGRATAFTGSANAPSLGGYETS